MNSNLQQNRVLAEAVANVARALDVTEEQLGNPVGESALQLIRVYELLISLTGGKKEASYWMRSSIKTLHAVPLELISQEGGLDKVEGYLQRMSSK